MFHPNPQSMPTYGKILKEILINKDVEETFVTSNTSKYTLLLSQYITPSSSSSYTTIAFPIFCTPYQNRSKMTDASTQTDILTDFMTSLHHSSTYLERTHFSFQTPPISSSFYSSHPPPYQFQNKDRFDRRGIKRGFRGTGSNESYGNLTLSMFINNDSFNQPQTSRGGRRQKGMRANGRRGIKMEAKGQSGENVADGLSGLMNTELNIIDEMIAEDCHDK